MDEEKKQDSNETVVMSLSDLSGERKHKIKDDSSDDEEFDFKEEVEIIITDNNHSLTIEEKRRQKQTLEDKRKKILEQKMTIEEKRIMERKSTTEKKIKKETKVLDVLNYLLLLLTTGMIIYIAFQINRYFKVSYTMIFVVTAFVLLLLVLLLVLKKKQKIGLAMNVVLAIIMGIGCLGSYKISGFTNKVFDNSESETVMIVALKESYIDNTTSFEGKKIAFVTSDGSINSYVVEQIGQHNKTGIERVDYASHKEAYEGLENGDVELMVYTSLTRQKLLEEDIDSWNHVKVVMEFNREMAPVESKTIDITKDPFNIYISGVDLTSKNINEKGSSDVNIIMTVNPQSKKVIMQTIPRDSWTPLPCEDNNHTKLTYAGAYGGIDCSIKAIEAMYDIEINYYAKINFQGVVDLVDALGGITVNSDVAFCTSPGSGDCFNAGPNTLNGARALTFSRIRKVFSEGDIARGRHQMEVINAVIRKFSDEPTMSHLNSLLGAVENNFTTNLSEGDIGKALELFMSMKSELSNIQSYTMEGNMIWQTDEVSFEYLYYFYPNEGQMGLFQQRIKEVMNTNS